MSSSNDLGATALKERVRTLEADLKASPMNHHVYSDLPFGIFCYPPRQEWAMRREIDLLKTRLEIDTNREIAFISLAELMWQAVDETEGLAAAAALEQHSGFQEAQSQVQDYLSDPEWRSLPDLLTERLSGLDPDRQDSPIPTNGGRPAAPRPSVTDAQVPTMRQRRRCRCFCR